MNLTKPDRAYERGEVAEHRWLPPLRTGSIVVALLAVTFAIDRETGSAPLQHLYYLPIVVAGFRFGLAGAVATAFAATVSYHLANPHLLTFRYGESDIVQIALFIAVGVVTALLTRDASRLRHLASTDDLTGLHNLRSFESRLTQIVDASHGAGAPVAMLVLDVDRLKSLNDGHGHLAGAEAVRTVGHIIKARMPGDAVACRYGGDEFVVALPRCSTILAGEIADDLRRSVNAAAPVLAGTKFPAGTLSISIGVAGRSFDVAPAPGDTTRGEALFRAADAALYRAKASGRNQTCVA
jgi:diguanylate cyclase (GGDEF)-like protein